MAKQLEAKRLNLSIHGNDRATGKNSGIPYNGSPQEPATARRPKRVKAKKSEQGKKNKF